jgi:selenoprotein W-related protein
MAEILRSFEHQVESVQLIPSDGGKFEVKVGDQLVYSKLKTGSHIEPTSLIELVGKAL